MINHSLNIRRSRPEDAAEILRLVEQEYKSPISQDEWLWRYEQRRACGQGVYWVAELDGEIVGGRGAIPLPLQCGQKEITIGHSVDTIVAKEHRRKGIFGSIIHHMLTEFRFGHVQEMQGSLSTPRPQAYWGAVKNGYYDIGQLDTWVRPLKISRSVFKLIHLHGFSRTLKRMPERALSAEKVNSSWQGLEDKQIEIVSDPELGDLTPLWLSRSSSEHVQVKKDADRLQWRYLSSPTEYQFFIMRNPSGSLAGAIICKHKLIRGFDVYDIIDLAALNNQIYRHLLKVFVRWAKQQRAELIRLIMHNYLPRYLMFSIGFLPVWKNTHWMLNDWSIPLDIQRNFIFDFNNWRLVAGDIDTF
jgi:hypothetical protein